jgi:hypothetical protein
MSYGWQLGNDGYVIGGSDYHRQMSPSDATFNAFESFNDNANSWQSRTPGIGYPLFGQGVFVLGGEGYIIGGSTDTIWNANHGWIGPTSLVKKYNKDSENWDSVQNHPHAIIQSGGFSLTETGKGYIYGGNIEDVLGFNKELREFDPVADSWTRRNDALGQTGWYPPSTGTGSIGYSRPGLEGAGFQSWDEPTDVWTYLADQVMTWGSQLVT